MSRLLRGISFLFVISLLCAAPTRALAQVSFGVGFAVNFGPPPLPYYVQPPCPQPNYIWNPGYWAWGDAGYYWVPGTWVEAAGPGLYWTPGYWNNDGSGYAWNAGYWAPQVGFYGGINYGYGYYGNGYAGGNWQGNNFRYNTAVSNINRGYVHNYYDNRAAYNGSYNDASHRISYNGGNGGVQARPNSGQLAVLRGRRVPATAMQREHIQTAAGDRNLYASVNKGRPQQVAVARPYSSNSKPANYTPVRAQDRQAAQSHIVARNQPAGEKKGPQTSHVTNGQAHAVTKAPEHAQPVQHANAQAKEQVHHTAAAPAHAQPQTHAYTAPKQAEVHHAATQPQHAYAPPQQAQHVAQPQHVQQPQHAYAPPQQQHMAQPQQQHMSQPQQQHMSQPQQHMSQPQAPHGGGGGGGGGGQHGGGGGGGGGEHGGGGGHGG